MLAITQLLPNLPKRSSRCVEDAFDSLNFRASVALFLLFAAITGTKQHFGKPIQCMPPAESSDSWVEYYRDYCYIDEKLSLDLPSHRGPLNGGPHAFLPRVLQPADDKKEPVSNFYQWVPYVLVLQAAAFLIPKVFWTIASTYWCNGLDMKTAVSEASELRALFGDQRKDAVYVLANFLSTFFNSTENVSLSGRRCTLWYTVTKWLCMFISLGQIVFLTHFVGKGDHGWAIEVLLNTLNNVPRSANDFFPRVVFCRINQMELGSTHEIVVQCLLTLNFINEKVFAFAWVWLMSLAIVNFLSSLWQTLFLIMPMLQLAVADSILPSQAVMYAAAADCLGLSVNKRHEGDRKLLEYFVGSVLRADGVLLFSLIRSRAGGMVVHDIANELWKLRVQPAFNVGSVHDMNGPEKNRRALRAGSFDYQTTIPRGEPRALVRSSTVPQRRPRSCSLGALTLDGDEICSCDTTIPVSRQGSETNHRIFIRDNRRTSRSGDLHEKGTGIL